MPEQQYADGSTDATQQNPDHRDRLFYDSENIAFYREAGTLYMEKLDEGDTASFDVENPDTMLDDAANESLTLEEFRDRLT